MNDFKVGDWVKPIYGKSFKQILEVDNSKALETFILIPEGLAPTWFNAKWFTKWQPQEGEWCWFEATDFDTDTSTFLFGKYNYDNFFIVDFLDEQLEFISCEPFIGELPSFIKKH